MKKTKPSKINVNNKRLTELAEIYKKDKSEKNFKILHDNLKNNLYFWIKKFFKNNKEDTQDIFSETMITIWKKIDSFDPKLSAFKTWAFTIAKNLAINKLKKINASVKREVSIFNSEDGSLIDIPIKEGDKLDKLKLTTIVVDEINKLPQEERVFFIDIYGKGLSYESSALKRNVKIHTVKNKLHSGKNKIKIKLKNNEVDRLFMERNFSLEDTISLDFQRRK